MTAQQSRLAPLASPKPGSFAEFWADVRRSLEILRILPWLVAIELTWLLTLASSTTLVAEHPEDPLYGLLSFVASLLFLAATGWVGAQRIAMRAVMVGEPIGLGQVGFLIARQNLRWYRLVLLLLPAGAVYFAVVVLSTDDLLATEPQMSLAGRVTLAILSGLGLVVLTLVTPALALETDRAREAWSKGLRRLRQHWRLVKWHALAPVIINFGPATLGVDEPWARGWALIMTFTTIIFRGAVVAVHLRIRDAELAAMPPPRPVIL